MATIEIPDDILMEIKEQVEAAAEKIIHDKLFEMATKFIDVTTISDSDKKMMHVLTGKVLSISAKWDE